MKKKAGELFVPDEAKQAAVIFATDYATEHGCFDDEVYEVAYNSFIAGYAMLHMTNKNKEQNEND